MVSDELKFFSNLQSELKGLFLEVCNWPKSFYSTNHKVITGRAIYLLGICIDNLDTRIKELITSEEKIPNNPPSLIIKENLNTAQKRFFFLTSKCKEYLDKIDNYLEDSEGLRDHPSISVLLTVKNTLLNTVELANKFERVNDDIPLEFKNQPNRDQKYELIRKREYIPPRSEKLSDKLMVKLHQIALCVELSAIEICSSFITDNPDMPWEFYFDLSRQCYDEARHTEMLIKRVEELGGKDGMLPIFLDIWESIQLGENLAEKIAIQQVIQEGHGLDSDVIFTEYMANLKDYETAAIFDYITVDEVSHVRLGCKWLIYLCKGDKDQALITLDNAYKKLIHHGYRPKMPVQEKERIWAGMSEDQIAKAKEVVEKTIKQS
nr:DUF455 family protein [Geobacillus stearothermophilus]